MTLGQGNLLYNRYRVVEILGRGGMGAVYRATDESLGVDVALKENLFTTDDYARQFRMEAVILAGIRHPNLPRVSDHFVIDDMGQYLVMDYIEGDDLRQQMEKTGPITEAQAIRIGAAACDALAYLHTRKPPILHRDIKLGNIKITPDGQVYLVDFGLAKMGWEHEETMTGARAMTPGYSPPEQYGSARTDARSDIYSLGATLYAALTGVIPEDSLMRAVDGVTLTPLREHSPEVSPRLAAVVEKALETAAANRYQSAEAFKAALLGENAPAVASADIANMITTRPVPTPAQPQPAKQSMGWRLLFFAMILVVILAGAILFNPFNRQRLLGILSMPATSTLAQAASPFPTYTPLAQIPIAQLLSSPTPAPATLPASTSTVSPTKTVTPVSTTTETPTEQVEPATATLPVAEATLTPAVNLPGGGRGQLAFASIVNKVAQIFLINADGSGLQALTDDPKGACSMDWSPDGKQLVYISPCSEKAPKYANTALYILNVENGTSSPLPFPADGDFQPAWSPDGTQIAFTSMRDNARQIYIYKLGDTAITRLTLPTGDITESFYPVWSPDSSQITYTVSRSGLYQIWNMTADGKNKKQLFSTGGSFWDYLPSWSPDGASLLFSQGNIGLSGLSSLLRFDFAGGAPTNVPIPPPVVDADYSPDGEWVAYETNVKSNQDIYICQLLECKPQRLTTSTQIDFDPVWRPGE